MTSAACYTNISKQETLINCAIMNIVTYWRRISPRKKIKRKICHLAEVRCRRRFRNIENKRNIAADHLSFGRMTERNLSGDKKQLHRNDEKQELELHLDKLLKRTNTRKKK